MMASLSVDILHMNEAKAMQRLLISMMDDKRVPECYRQKIKAMIGQAERKRIDISELFTQ